jgi:hypothetical protein
MFRAIGATIQAITNIIVALSRTTEKTVQLCENEVDMLQFEQKHRLTSQRMELEALIKQAQLEQH